VPKALVAVEENRRSLGSPGFPVESCGFGQLHVVLFRKNHISGTGESCEVGNPGTLGMTKERVVIPFRLVSLAKPSDNPKNPTLKLRNLPFLFFQVKIDKPSKRSVHIRTTQPRRNGVRVVLVCIATLLRE
jgi:hypothetical protein